MAFTEDPTNPRNQQNLAYQQPVVDLLGFDPSTYVSGGVSGASLFQRNASEFTQSLSTWAVRHTLQRDPDIPFHSYGTEGLHGQMRDIGALGDEATSCALASHGKQMEKLWDSSILTAVIAASGAAIESLAMDARGGIPSDEAVNAGETTFSKKKWGKRNHFTKELNVVTELGSEALGDNVRSEETLSVQTIFETLPKEAVSGPYDFYYNQDEWHEAWRLVALMMHRQRTITTVGHMAVSSPIDSSFLRMESTAMTSVSPVMIIAGGKTEHNSDGIWPKSARQDYVEFFSDPEEPYTGRQIFTPDRRCLRSIHGVIAEFKQLIEPADASEWMLHQVSDK